MSPRVRKLERVQLCKWKFNPDPRRPLRRRGSRPLTDRRHPIRARNTRQQRSTRRPENSTTKEDCPVYGMGQPADPRRAARILGVGQAILRSLDAVKDLEKRVAPARVRPFSSVFTPLRCFPGLPALCGGCDKCSIATISARPPMNRVPAPHLKHRCRAQFSKVRPAQFGGYGLAGQDASRCRQQP